MALPKRKFVPNSKFYKKKREYYKIKEREKLYTKNWDDIRRQVYKRDGYRCVLCGKKGKLHAHHIIPVRVSKDNSLKNLVTVCEECHKKLESYGFKLLQEGKSPHEVWMAEIKLIHESKKHNNKHN